MEMRLPVIFEIKLIVISSFYVNSGRERGNYCIRVYLSFIQHKCPERVWSLEVVIFS